MEYKEIREMDGITDALKNLRQAIEDQADFHCTSVTVFFNCEGYDVTQTHRTADNLKESGISMRNVKGEWIK